jgi:hypothetical protein
MRDPAGLYDLTSRTDEVPVGLHLVAGLTGFADAGSAVTQFGEYLLDTLEHRVIATFDTDALLDYRARRPTISFDQDHLTDYRPSQLSLYLMNDEIGQQFLLLTGFEPDFQWERFTAAVLQLIEKYQVKTTTWVHAIPMPVPHTRPIGVTVSGNRAELVESMSVWRPRTQVPANALHLVEYRLQELGHPIAGFILLIPHYLADTEFPLAAVSSLESISAATGLIFPTDRLREKGRDFLSKIDDQDNPLRSPLTDEDGELPTADAIAAELENFLAIRRDDDSSSL